MNRRQLLLGVGAAAAGLLVPELWVPKRTYFLPPAGGWATDFTYIVRRAFVPSMLLIIYNDGNKDWTKLTPWPDETVIAPERKAYLDKMIEDYTAKLDYRVDTAVLRHQDDHWTGERQAPIPPLPMSVVKL